MSYQDSQNIVHHSHPLFASLRCIQADARKTVPKLESVEWNKLVELSDYLRNVDASGLNLANSNDWVSTFWQHCSAAGGTQPISNGEHAKKLFVKAAICATLVHECATKVLVHHMNCRRYHAKVILIEQLNIDNQLITPVIIDFTTFVKIAMDMGLPTRQNKGLFVQIGVFLEGSNKYYVRGGGNRKSKDLDVREKIVDYLLAYQTSIETDDQQLTGTVHYLEDRVDYPLPTNPISDEDIGAFVQHALSEPEIPP